MFAILAAMEIPADELSAVYLKSEASRQFQRPHVQLRRHLVVSFTLLICAV